MVGSERIELPVSVDGWVTTTSSAILRTTRSGGWNRTSNLTAYETVVLPLHHAAKVAIQGIEPHYPGLQSGALPLC